MNVALFVRSATAVAATVLFTGLVQAEDFGFDCVTNNNATNCATGEAQFDLSFTQTVVNSGYQLDFKLTNSGPLASSITDVYFDWGSPAPVGQGSGQIIQGAGVKFDWDASPGNLPGGNTIGFTASTGLTADSDSPVSANGVNSGESITFRFLTGYAGALDDLYSGTLRVGLHAQSFANGGSESFVTTPVPEPSAVAMMLVGLGVVGLAASRRRQAVG
jgi:hypothetical protein